MSISIYLRCHWRLDPLQYALVRVPSAHWLLTHYCLWSALDEALLAFSVWAKECLF